MPTKRIEVEKHDQYSTDKKRTVLESVFDESQGKNLPKEVFEYFNEYFKKYKTTSYGYTESLDTTLNRWLEQFHLKYIANVRQDQKGPYKLQPHIIDIKFVTGTEDNVLYSSALVIYEDGN